MINRAILVGRLTKDIELRKTQSNLSVVQFTLACDKRIKPKEQGAPTADFINCVAWRQSADFLAKYAKKGSVVGVDGEIATRSYKDKSGNNVYVTEVVCENVRLIGGNREEQHQPEPVDVVVEPKPEPSYDEQTSLGVDASDLPWF